MESLPDLSALKGLTTATRLNLEKLGIRDLNGLLFHLPLRYVDETRITPIRDLRVGEQSQVEGVIIHAETQYRPRKAFICQLEDVAGDIIYLRFLHFYPSQVAALKVDTHVRALGDARQGYFGMEMVHPVCRKVGDRTALKEALTPVYPTTAGLTQAVIRKLIAQALQILSISHYSEPMPKAVYQGLGLPSLVESLQILHAPPPEISLSQLEEGHHPAIRRLAFDELLAQQLSMRRHLAKRRALGAPLLKPQLTLTNALLAQLPFALTKAQNKVLAEISADLSQPHPMHRLLQGDVGSGKTIVAALAALQAIENGWQAALMAPTEILAEQHFNKLSTWLIPLGVKVAWLSGSQSKAERAQTYVLLGQHEVNLVVGTHALFQEQVQFAKLGLVIVDEQHRFGVQQRLSLRMKGVAPHQLMMSATPIPRTLAMSYYADLDVSVIDELPPGRTPINTKLVSDTRRDEVLMRVREACAEGKQAYWVCPLIEESEALQLTTALETYENLKQALPELEIGLVHGRMKSAEKQAAMLAFSQHATHLLVATTVIEVGVDVPNASLMVIEHAERMGLSQLHQLRGRVGRGTAKSVCILLYQTPLSETARERLKIIYENTDGFEIARADLNLRGPGEFLGLRQSGVPMLRIADLERDADLLESARSLADDLLKTQPAVVEAHLRRWLGQAEAYGTA